MGDGSLSSRRRVSGRSVGEGMRAMGAVQAGFYYLFSLVSVESGPRGPSLSVYILHIPVDDTAFGTPRIRSDFRSGSDALLKPSTHSPDRLLTCASSEDFSHSRSSFSLAALESSACGHSSFSFLDLAELVEGSVRLPTARPHRFPLAAFSPHPFLQFLFPRVLPSRCARALGFETRLPPRTFQ